LSVTGLLIRLWHCWPPPPPWIILLVLLSACQIPFFYPTEVFAPTFQLSFAHSSLQAATHPGKTIKKPDRR
jgi:hypothetical protein